MCGEKVTGQPTTPARPGSPPRVRGKVAGNLEQGRVVGITPACAGKSSSGLASACGSGDHPRACGEKGRTKQFLDREPGSPPRMRGKGHHGEQRPHHAGKSSRHQKRTAWEEDHPRVCGEKSMPSRTSSKTTGSPPRVRGKVSAGKILLHDGGITPACAGKSSIQHLTASLGEFEVQKGHPVPHLRQRLQVWPDHARHLRHGLILHASLSAGQGRRLCPGPCPDTAGSGTPRGPSPAKHPHTSPPAATPGGCRAWQSGATAPGSR